MKRDSVYSWLVVAMLWAVVTLNYIDRLAIFSVLPLLRHELGASNVELGMMASIFLWVYGALSPFLGYLGDRHSRRALVLGSLLLWSLVTVATGLAKSTTEIILLRGLMGVSEACYMPAALALIADYHGPQQRSTAVGIHQSGIYVGSILGGVLPAYLADHYGWRVGFYSLGILGVILAGLLYFVLHDAPRSACTTTRDNELPGSGQPSFLENCRTLRRIPTVIVLCLVVLVFSTYFWVFSAWLPLFFYDRFGLSLTEAGIAATLYTQTASVAGVLVGGPVADYGLKWAPRSRMWVQWVGITLPVPFLIFLGSSPSLFWAILPLVVFGLGRGLWDCNNMPIISDVTLPPMRATGYGIFNSAGMFGGAIGTLAVGMLASWAGLSVLLSTSAGLALVASIIAWIGATRFLARDMRRMQSGQEQS